MEGHILSKVISRFREDRKMKQDNKMTAKTSKYLATSSIRQPIANRPLLNRLETTACKCRSIPLLSVTEVNKNYIVK